MTARIVLSCDGTWEGQRCKGNLPTVQVSFPMARHVAREAGWRYTAGKDLCPPHASQ